MTSFDLVTPGLWAPCASSAPHRYELNIRLKRAFVGSCETQLPCEPKTSALLERCSNQLSYKGKKTQFDPICDLNT